MSDLKPCPFCGGEARYYVDNKYADCHQVICTKCAVTKSDEDYEYVISDWNTRASGWISVSERLPEANMPVLVNYHNMIKSNIQSVAIYFDRQRWRQLIGGSDFDDSSITHWMPLPEPPK